MKTLMRLGLVCTLSLGAPFVLPAAPAAAQECGDVRVERVSAEFNNRDWR